MKHIFIIFMIGIVIIGPSQQTEGLTAISLNLNVYGGPCDSIAISTDAEEVQVLLTRLVINGEDYSLQRILLGSKPVAMENIGYWSVTTRSTILRFRTGIHKLETLSIQINPIGNVTDGFKVELYNDNQIVDTFYIKDESNDR